ncbi:hypothetical protein GCM10008910_16770 [Faecalicatena orotica]
MIYGEACYLFHDSSSLKLYEIQYGFNILKIIIAGVEEEDKHKLGAGYSLRSNLTAGTGMFILYRYI